MMIFPFIPAQQSTLKLGFNTAVLGALGGNEQRMALRYGASQRVDYSFNFNASEYQQFINWYRANGSETYRQPNWWWAKAVGAVSAAATTLNVTSSVHNFQAGQLLYLCDSARNYELVLVDSVAAQALTLTAPVNNAYANAFLMPIDDAAILSAPSISRRAGNKQKVDVAVRLHDDLTPNEAHGLTVFKGLPVQENPSIAVSGIAESLTHNFDVIDENTGPFEAYAPNPFTKLASSLTWRAKSQSEVNELLNLLAYTNGQQKAFWLPSFNPLNLVSDAAASSTTLAVEYAGFEHAQTPFYLYILQETGSECVQVNSVISGSETEQLTLAAPLTSAVSKAQLISLCTLTRMRQQADNIEIKRDAFNKFTTSFAVTEVFDELSS